MEQISRQTQKLALLFNTWVGIGVWVAEIMLCNADNCFSFILSDWSMMCISSLHVLCLLLFQTFTSCIVYLQIMIPTNSENLTQASSSKAHCVTLWLQLKHESCRLSSYLFHYLFNGAIFLLPQLRNANESPNYLLILFVGQTKL